MDLYNHQREIVKDDKPITGLWLGTGSGKTLVALMLAKGNTLVIAPKTQKEDGNWERQLKEWIEEKDGQDVLTEKGLLRIKDPHIKLTVVSKESFRRDHSSLPPCDTLIIDEAHTVAGATPSVRWVKKKPIPRTSQLFEVTIDYIQRVKPKRIYLCTATPIRSPMVVWGLARILGKPWDFYKWREAFYFRLPMSGREVWTPKTDKETKDRLAKAVQSIGYTGQLSDYFDVPTQTYRTIYLELNQKQKDRIKKLPLEFPDPIVLLGKKHQVENGVLAGDEFNAPESFPNEKLDKISELALEFPRMIVFVKYIAQIKQIEDQLRSEGYNVYTMTGAVKDRGELLEKLRSMDNYIFIVQAQISAGWELPECPVMVFASMSYSIVDKIQSEGRILRANALKKNLYITLVVRNCIDEAVHKALLQKKDFSERIYLNL